MINYPFVAALSIIAYLFATGLLLYQLYKKPIIKWSILVASLAFILHAITLWVIIYDQGRLDFSLFNMGSLVSLTIVGLIILSSLFKPVEIMGILFFPVAVITIILSYSVMGHYLVDTHSVHLFSHILLSILAYSLLSIAAVQAILVWFQNKQLHNHHPAGLLRFLPPLQTMETLLFEIIALGTLFLTTSLISGFIYLEDMFAQHVAHKTVLGLLSWSTFTVLLWGRHYRGWRGKRATTFVLAGFGFLMLAYFGSKLAKEFIIS